MQPGPAGLVAGTHAVALVAVEVLVEEQVVSEMRVGLEQLGLAESGAVAVFVFQKQLGQALR